MIWPVEMACFGKGDGSEGDGCGFVRADFGDGILVYVVGASLGSRLVCEEDFEVAASEEGDV